VRQCATLGSFVYSFDTDTYPGGDLYATGYPTNPFRKSQASGRMVEGHYVPPPAGVFVDANFRLQGRQSGSSLVSPGLTPPDG
jgi:hypothetical protein